jgi:D-cysteine desulfhydrase
LPGELWLKRDDLNAPEFGGNKVRALEFLLGTVAPGETVLVVGGEGSTHVLTTAAHAARLGIRTRAIRWVHDMNATAHQVAAQTGEFCAYLVTVNLLEAVVRIVTSRVRGGARWIPVGGTSPLGILGHVNAGLELAEQVAQGALPAPERVVVPLGSGGTAAGLALGLWIAGVDSAVVGARVAPRITTNRWRVLRLARATSALITRLTGERLPPLPRQRVRVVHDVYGGAYGRPTAAGDEAAAILQRTAGVRLDATYSAKAFAAALALARRGAGRTLFWVTFDGRWIGEAGTGDKGQET